MSCCGQRAGRMTIRQADIDNGLRVKVAYLGGRSVTVVGSVTGVSYAFSGRVRVQDVDPRDAAGLVSDRRFVLKGVTPARTQD